MPKVVFSCLCDCGWHRGAPGIAANGVPSGPPPALPLRSCFPTGHSFHLVLFPKYVYANIQGTHQVLFLKQTFTKSDPCFYICVLSLPALEQETPVREDERTETEAEGNARLSGCCWGARVLRGRQLTTRELQCGNVADSFLGRSREGRTVVPADKGPAHKGCPWFCDGFLQRLHVVFSATPTLVVIPSLPLHPGNVCCVSRAGVGNAGSTRGCVCP